MSTTVYRRFIITVTVVMAAMMQLIDTSIVNVALPHIMGNVGADLSEAGWVVTAYVFANVVVIPMTGWLAEFFGRKTYYLMSIVVFVIASIFCGQATSIWELIIFRFIQGLGGGGLLPTSRVILVENFPPEDLGLANALFGMGVVIGPTIGPTLGGWLTTHYSWRWIFYVNIPVGIVAFLMAYINVEDVKAKIDKIRSIDWWGIILLVVGFGSLQIVLEQGEKENWFDATYIVYLSILATVGIILFIWRELTTEDPVVDLRVLKNRNLAIGAIFGFIVGFGLYASVFIFPVYLQNLLGYSAMQTGLVLLPGALTAGLMMPVVGFLLKQKVSARLMAALGFFIFFIFSWKMSGLTLESGTGDFFYPLILRGIGLGCLSVPINTIALTGLQGHNLSEGSGFLSMTRQLGGSFGIALVATFIDWRKAMHWNDLVGNLSPYNEAFTMRASALYHGFLSSGSAPATAHQQSYMAMKGMLIRQTSMLSYNDIFLIIGVFFMICIPLLLFTYSGDSEVEVPPAGE
jgi:DHA2 family multidrug resistance protein